jgi:hypothetical protein
MAMAISIGVIPVYANISKDFVQPEYNAQGQELFAYNVKLIIETGTNGEWLFDKNYSISESLSLTYLNTSLYNSSSFYINFYALNPFEGGMAFFVGTLNWEISEGNITQQQPNCELAYYITTNAVRTEYIAGDFTWTAYDNGQIANYTVPNNLWGTPTPIAINTVASTSTSLFTPLTILTITIVVIIAIVMVFLLLFRRHRKNR